MKLTVASAFLFGTSCAGFQLRPVDAFIIFGHHQPPITTAPRRINANLELESSASPKFSCRVAHSSQLFYSPTSRDDDSAGESDNSAQDDPNSDSAKDEKDTISAEATNADAAPNSQIIGDVDCYDLCDAFGEEESVEDHVVFGPEQSEAAKTAAPANDTPATPPQKVPSAEQEQAAPARPPKDVKTMRQNLELHWQITSSSSECDLEADIRSCSDPCPTCHGTGRVECRFCGGTGFFTLGEMVMGGGKVCPICNHDGEEECVQCRGSGWVANWRQHNLTGLEP